MPWYLGQQCSTTVNALLSIPPEGLGLPRFFIWFEDYKKSCLLFLSRKQNGAIQHDAIHNTPTGYCFKKTPPRYVDLIDLVYHVDPSLVPFDCLKRPLMQPEVGHLEAPIRVIVTGDNLSETNNYKHRPALENWIIPNSIYTPATMASLLETSPSHSAVSMFLKPEKFHPATLLTQSFPNIIKVRIK